MIRMGMHEAKSNLSKLVDLGLGGAEVTITRNGTPVARIVPLEQRRPSLNDVRGI
ncbi:MAG: type II toxin-antitoxin system Phd/YefM family antitoxin [Miltoncostaeaceae bacterium]